MSQPYGHYEYNYPSPIATAPPQNKPYRDSFETEIPLGTPVQNRAPQDFSSPPHEERHPHFADRSPSIIPAYPYMNTSVASASSPPAVPSHSAAGYYSPRSKHADINQYNDMPYSPDRHGYGPKIGEDDDRRHDSMNMVGTTGLLKPLDRNMPNQGFMRLESADPPYHAASRTGPIAWIWGPTRIPIFSWLTALAMAAVLCYEFVQNKNLTGSVIQTQTATQPFNPMIGPSSTVLINLGARFVACIRSIPQYPVSQSLGPCFTEGTSCSLEQICGLGGFKNPLVPDQSFRFVTPIFIHAGIIHYLMNMLTQLRLGAQLERELGSLRFAILYMAAGIWGFIFGALFGSPSRPSMGCSGALFGLIGFMFVDILLNWRDTVNPWRELSKLAVTTLISLALGLLPGLDNFAHLGGFIIGIVAGVMLIPNRKRASRRFIMFTWVARVIALVLLIVIFVVTIKEFYSVADPSQICPNCKYLSCLPVSNWCD